MYKHAKKSKSMFEQLVRKRTNWEDTWELCARNTIPHIFLDDETRMSGIDPEDLMIGESVGAECLNNFVSQISRLAFPEDGAFYRAKAKEENTPNLDKLSSTAQEEIFRKFEERGMYQLKVRKLSRYKFQLMLQLLGLGNVTWHLPKERQDMQVFDLNDVAVRRTPKGDVADIIIRDKTDFQFLSKSTREYLKQNKKNYKDTDCVHMYTHVYLNKHNKYSICYSVDDIELPTDENFYSAMDKEYHASAINLVRGSHYGTGIVGQYLPIIHKVNVYADSNTDVAVSGSLVNWGVDPAANLRPNDWANREQGQAFALKQNQVFPLVSQVGQHLQLAQSAKAELVATLHRVFLMFTAIQRDAERVTAEEIRLVANKLEETHSGLYTLIAESLQRPLALNAIALVDDEELAPYKNEIDVSLVTAIETMSRSAELNSILSALNDTSIFNNVPPQVVEQLKVNDITKRIFINHNLPIGNFVKSDEEVQQERQQMADAAAQQAAPALNQTQVFQANDALTDRINDPLF